MYIEGLPGMKFEVRPLDVSWPEFAVYAVHPGSGNDSALIAVFESEAAAVALCALLNKLATL